jgi:hypothetical protein
LNSILYISDEEIWCNGVSYTSGRWLVRITSAGEILSERTFTDAPGKNPAIQYIAIIDDLMMFGFTDGDK